MNEPKWVTVAQAVILTDRSKTVIYEIITSGNVATEDSSRGTLVNLNGLRTAIAARRPGRPRGTATRR